MFHVPHFDDPKYWDLRAEELRSLATRIHDEKDKGLLLGLADDCQKLSLMAQMRIQHGRFSDILPPLTDLEPDRDSSR